MNQESKKVGGLLSLVNSALKEHNTAVTFLLFFAIMIKVVLLAWNSDDAYHAYEMARNLVEGNGFVYNVGERVNASTCPFFTLSVAGVYFLTRDMFLSGIGLNIVFSGIAIYILISEISKKSVCLGVLLSIAIFLSKSFISYTTAGLENSMLFMLTALFLYVYWNNTSLSKVKLFVIALIMGLVAGTRSDCVLILLPAGMAIFFTSRYSEEKFGVRMLIGFLGITPFLSWLLFSLWYYGFMFPNTAYIKLNTGYPLTQYIAKGIEYYRVTYSYDSFVVCIPLVTIFLSVIKKYKKLMLVTAGVSLYMLYVIYIGGDFMVGRHFTVIYYVSLYSLAMSIPNLDWNAKQLLNISERVALVSMAVYIANAGMASSFNAVVDERKYYFEHTSLLGYVQAGDSLIKETWDTTEILEKDTGGELTMCTGILKYYYGGKNIYFDKYGLGDALLARLPAAEVESWRIGHMYRIIPDGYTETIIEGENKIEDDKIAEYYDHLSNVISGDLFQMERLRDIVYVNTHSIE